MNESSDALAVPIAVAMRRPTLLGVPAMPILAAPLIVRRAQVEEAGPLAALLGRAYPTETWDAAGTEHELFGDEGTHLRRDTVIPQWFQASKAAAASDGHAVHC